ncbi:MAG: hypothetical protein MJA32_04235, partial [Proteobacteria bacterium]|nr:hypothetical protein [Pseudomonadota bacterium]
FDSSRTTRGFTGHEMVDSVGIVHMNGRIYDPFLGRFLQSDNFVQDPTNTQSHNRYSYVWNNPLNATDPSGEFVFTLFAMAVVAGVESISLFAVTALFTVAGTLDALMAGADLSDGFLTGIISGLSAGAFSYVGSTWFGKLATDFSAGLYAAKILVHGTIGGITSVLQGGKFGHGFASAGLTAASSTFNNSNYIHKNSNGFSWRRVAIGAAIGGTASKLSGGKFANGAMTGAFSQALNQENGEQDRANLLEAERKAAFEREWNRFISQKAYESTLGSTGYDSASGLDFGNPDVIAESHRNELLGNIQEVDDVVADTANAVAVSSVSILVAGQGLGYGALMYGDKIRTAFAVYRATRGLHAASAAERVALHDAVLTGIAQGSQIVAPYSAGVQLEIQISYLAGQQISRQIALSRALTAVR